MIKKLRCNKEIIWSLATNDFSSKYAGSVFGVFWAFFQPVITIIIYSCVFQFGLKSTSPIENASYIFWFSAGMIPWFFFSEAIRSISNVYIEYGYLVKKVLFDVELLPIVKLISAAFVHFVFIILLFFIAFFNQESITIYVLQLVYYLLCNMALSLALSKIASSLILFFRDLSQIINIALDIGLWATPIIWPYNIVPNNFQWILKLNPLFYIIEGYRDCFVSQQWFWNRPYVSIYFWIITVFLYGIGEIIFKRMRPQFADVL